MSRFSQSVPRFYLCNHLASACLRSDYPPIVNIRAGRQVKTHPKVGQQTASLEVNCRMNIVTVLFFMIYVARDSKTQDSVAGSYESFDGDKGNDVNMQAEKGINVFQGDKIDR